MPRRPFFVVGGGASAALGPRYAVTVNNLAPEEGDDVTVTARLLYFDGDPEDRTVTWSKIGVGGSFASPTSQTNSSGIATVVFTVGADGVTHTVTATDEDLYTGTSPAIAVSGGGGGPELDEELQPWADGDYDNGWLDLYDLPSGRFDGTQVLVGSVRIGTPAIASVEDSDDIILDVPDAELTDRSVFANDKGYRITQADHASGAIYGSAGPAGTVAGGNDPDLVVDDPDEDGWFAGDLVPLEGVFHVRTATVPTGYAVTVSNNAPEADEEYTAVAQAKIGGADLHRIGIELTPSLIGTAGGSVAEGTLYTDKNGQSNPAHVTPAPFPADQQVRVTDGSATGDSEHVVTQEGPMWELIAETVKIGNGSSGPAETVTDEIDTRGADLIVVGWENFYAADPVALVADAYGNEDDYVHQPVVAAGGIVANLQAAHIISPVVGQHHTFTVRGAGAGAGYIPVTVKAFRLRSGTPVYNNDQVDNIVGGVSSIQPGALTPPDDNCLVITMSGNSAADLAAPTVDAPFDDTLINQAGVGGTTHGVGMAHESQGVATERDPTWSGSGAIDRAALICSFGSA